MWSHSITCHPTQVNTPHLNPSQTGRYSVYLPRRDRRLSWPRWLVTYRDSSPAHSRWKCKTQLIIDREDATVKYSECALTTYWSQVRRPNRSTTRPVVVVVIVNYVARRRHRVASSGRRVAPPWPRMSPGADPVSWLSWSVQCGHEDDLIYSPDDTKRWRISGMSV